MNKYLQMTKLPKDSIFLTEVFEKIIQKWNSEYRWTLSGVVTWRRSALWATNRQRAE